ncbi:unnamed protein product [Protopolystoma xenopodis]|uniref:Uncharacterized protein n=1 Tax=Protopolystoma xenopodis TaxID=117903 RepID=A0A448X406_9PLAT|nr:unnamed protein product [Protopolystoma xenopodis]
MPSSVPTNGYNPTAQIRVKSASMAVTQSNRASLISFDDPVGVYVTSAGQLAGLVGNNIGSVGGGGSGGLSRATTGFISSVRRKMDIFGSKRRSSTAARLSFTSNSATDFFAPPVNNTNPNESFAIPTTSIGSTSGLGLGSLFSVSTSASFDPAAQCGPQIRSSESASIQSSLDQNVQSKTKLNDGQSLLRHRRRPSIESNLTGHEYISDSSPINVKILIFCSFRHFVLELHASPYVKSIKLKMHSFFRFTPSGHPSSP